MRGTEDGMHGPSSKFTASAAGNHSMWDLNARDTQWEGKQKLVIDRILILDSPARGGITGNMAARSILNEMSGITLVAFSPISGGEVDFFWATGFAF